MNFKEVKKNPLVLEFLRQTEITLKVHNYTDHGLGHSNLVAARARTVAKEIHLSKREQEMCAIAGFCHDFANFLNRTYHNYLGALIFQEIFKAVKDNKLGINKRKKRITLNLKIDTNFVPVMEYFEIFTERMVYCRKAAKYLGYKFGLVINNFKLL
ncbi:MAG: hypothetical protein QME61_03455 [Patescibacteria group bacterium]|nr:hypothetical protein [Patescibacteria group bacterium]